MLGALGQRWRRWRGRDAVRGEILLAPITPASYLAARAALRIGGPHDECDLGALPEADLVAFVDVATVSADTLSYADTEALRSVAEAVYAGWRGGLDQHARRAAERGEVVFETLNWWPPKSDDDAFVPEMMARGDGWTQIRDLPLWEASMSGMIAAMWAHREKTLNADE